MRSSDFAWLRCVGNASIDECVFGEWWEGKKDADGKMISLSHSNAKYTMRLKIF